MELVKNTFLRIFQIDYSGRINRAEYVAVCLALGDLFFMVAFFMDFLPMSPHSIFVPIVGMALMISIILLWIPQGIKRLHDMGSSGAQALILAIPLINIFFSFYLMLAKGDEDENNYGEIPESSPTKEEWFLLLIIFIMAWLIFTLPMVSGVEH